MATNRILFGGNRLPCTVERFPAIRKPARKFRQYNIPGKNGDVFFQDDAFENVIVSYQVYATDEYGDAQTAWKEMAAILYKKGYQRLQDTYDDDHFRKAVFNGPIDVENSWNTHGRATLEFNCRPERYLKDGITPYSFDETTYSPVLWKVSDLSNHAKNPSNWPAGTTEVYEFTILSTWGNDIYILNYNNFDGSGRVKYLNIFGQTPDAATYSTSVSAMYAYNGKLTLTHVNDTTILIPVQYFNGQPMLSISDRVDPDAPLINYGTDGMPPVENNYMPCFPTIILHNENIHTGEVVAAHINGLGIYIDYDQDSPYYFVDTENATIMKSDTRNGNKIIATNARMDAGLRLESGDNIIYTSPYYSIPELVPNTWEL